VSGELRCRPLSSTLALAVTAAARAGVSRVSDVTGFAVPGVPVFQATRPAARSLAVSQGKGLTPTAAIVGALLESVELWSAESLAKPRARTRLADLPGGEVATWSGPRKPLALALDPSLARAWLPAVDLLSGRTCQVPWDMLSLDCTQDKLDCRPTSMGLACGNTRVEALVSGVAEVLEHHGAVQFDLASPRERLASQIALESVDDPIVRQLLGRVEAAGFRAKAWSMANDEGFAAITCTLFRREVSLDGIAPSGGSGCHPHASVALRRALLEAIQTRAGLVAGARDDLRPEDYERGGEREATLAFRSLAFGDGQLDWRSVPSANCSTSEECLEFLLAKAERMGGLPVIAFDHDPPHPGLHLAHVIAPGLQVGDRRHEDNARPPPAPVRATRRARGTLARRKLLFAGPSIAGLAPPDEIELRPPARCGDLAALLDDPPAVVGLVDGVFKLAPTVWHKEILSLLAAGTEVIGGASLGALRAAELARFGMTGIGTIYDLYRSGMMVRDDAVMLVHAPAELDYAPFSLPLVDAEYALSLIELAGPVRRAMQRIVRRAPFETRTWRGCLAEYRARTGRPFPIALETLEAQPSLKQIDARQVIDAIAAADARRSPAATWPMPALTDDFRALLARSAPAFAAGPV
jgi:YcaO-like protein with predicted kinase domain